MRRGRIDSARKFVLPAAVRGLRADDLPPSWAPGHEPGTVITMTPEDIAGNQVMHSLHDLRLVDVLQNADLLGRAPQAVVIGVQIQRIEQWVLELSEPVEEALPVAVAAVLVELRKLGVEPTPRESSDVDARIIAALRSYEPMPES